MKYSRSHTNHPLKPQPLLIVIAAMLLAGMVGCRQEVQTSYIPPPTFDKSLNGISVFIDMTTKRGHALRTEMVINAYAKNCDVLVWFSRRTGCPKEETVKQIEGWLAAKPGRTFVFVGRAFESTADYWTAIEKLALAPTEEDRRKIASRKSDAENDLRSFLGKPNGMTEKKNARQTEPENPFLFFDDENDDDVRRIGQNTNNTWFETSPREAPYKVTAISGAAEWTQAIDAGKLQLTCYEDWDFADDVESLLIAKGDVLFDRSTDVVVNSDSGAPVEEHTLVARKRVGESQAIFVTHAGFLLNYPLVNHEHRKLAGRLIDAFGPPTELFGRSTGIRVCIYIGNREIDFNRSNEVSEESPHVLLTLLHIWPLSVVLCHLIVLCAAFCFYKWPIFGRPRTISESPVTDFGKHIDACAELLADAKDDNDTLNQIMEAYHTHNTTRP